jgi:hypothetical protein
LIRYPSLFAAILDSAAWFAVSDWSRNVPLVCFGVLASSDFSVLGCGLVALC